MLSGVLRERGAESCFAERLIFERVLSVLVGNEKEDVLLARMTLS